MNHTMQKSSRWTPYLQTSLYYLGFIALGLSVASFGPTIESLARHTHTHLSEISFLFTARSLGYLAGSSQIGRLYDHVRSHQLMAAGILGMGIMLALVPVIPTLWVLTIVLMFLGMSEGILDMGGNTLLVWVHRDKVGPFMNGLHLFFGIGSFISPIIISQMVLLSGDITWAYWALALLMLPPFIGLLLQPGPVSTAPAQSQTPIQVQPVLIGLVAVLFFLFVGAETSFGGWIFTYSVKQNIAGESTAAILTSAFWGALTAGRLLGIPIAARFHPRSILFADLLVAGIGCVVALLNPSSSLATWVSTFLVGLGIASLFPTLLALAERSLPISARVMSYFFIGSSLGGMVLPWLIGQAIEPLGPWTMMALVMADLFLALTTLLVFLRLVRGSQVATNSQTA